MSVRTIVNGFLAIIGTLVGVIFLRMNDQLRSIDEHLKLLDDKLQAIVEVKDDLLKNAADLKQDIKDIGHETKGTHDDVIRLQEGMKLLEPFPEKIYTTREYRETGPFNTRCEAIGMSAKANAG